MSYPKNCATCPNENVCNSAMYMSGCTYFPPRAERQRGKFSIKAFFGKFFK